MSTTITTPTAAEILNAFGGGKQKYERKESQITPYILQTKKPEKKNESFEIVVRVIPNKHNEGNNPISKIDYHYNLGKYGSVVCLKNYGKECPIDKYVYSIFDKANDLKIQYNIDKKDKEAARSIPEIRNLFKLAYQYKEVPRYYMPVVPRSGEQEGKIVFFGFTDRVYDALNKQLKEFDAEDRPFNPISGYDMKIIITNTGQLIANKPVYSTEIMILSSKAKSALLHGKSEEEIYEFIDTTPNINDIISLEMPSEEKVQEIADYIEHENEKYINSLLNPNSGNDTNGSNITDVVNSAMTEEETNKLISELESELATV